MNPSLFKGRLIIIIVDGLHSIINMRLLITHYRIKHISDSFWKIKRIMSLPILPA